MIIDVGTAKINFETVKSIKEMPVEKGHPLVLEITYIDGQVERIDLEPSKRLADAVLVGDRA